MRNVACIQAIRHKYLLVWTSKNNLVLFLIFLCRKLHDSSWYLWTDRFTVLYNQACKDFHACQWPSDLTNDDEALALYFDKLNDKNHDAIEEVKSSSKQILTFSHFVPRCIVLLLPKPSIFLSFCLIFVWPSVLGMLDWITCWNAISDSHPINSFFAASIPPSISVCMLHLFLALSAS